MKWISNSINESKSLRNHYKLHSIDIIVKDSLPENVDIDFVIKYVTARIPDFLIDGVDIIYVGQFESLIQREVNALYEDGAIYITNDQDDEMDMIDDLVHELAHSNEDRFADIIYGDGKLEEEFLRKRTFLSRVLKHVGETPPPPQFLVSLNFDQDIDDYLYKDVGYTPLWNYVNGIFPSPYAATSVREYFASGLLDYLLDEGIHLSEISPILYQKIFEIVEKLNNEI